MESHLVILAPEKLKEYFERLQKYAMEHYEEDGWDSVVECVGFDDFVEDLTFFNIPLDWESIFQYYKESSKIWDERRRDIEKEIF